MSITYLRRAATATGSFLIEYFGYIYNTYYPIIHFDNISNKSWFMISSAWVSSSTSWNVSLPLSRCLNCTRAVSSSAWVSSSTSWNVSLPLSRCLNCTRAVSSSTWVISFTSWNLFLLFIFFSLFLFLYSFQFIYLLFYPGKNAEFEEILHFYSSKNAEFGFNVFDLIHGLIISI